MRQLGKFWTETTLGMRLQGVLDAEEAAYVARAAMKWERVVGMLREVEWQRGEDGDDELVCLWCGRVERTGHSDTCEVGQLLRGEDE